MVIVNKSVEESAFKHQKAVEDECSIIVGVNKYKSDAPAIKKIQLIDQRQTERQIEKIRKLQ